MLFILLTCVSFFIDAQCIYTAVTEVTTIQTPDGTSPTATVTLGSCSAGYDVVSAVLSFQGYGDINMNVFEIVENSSLKISPKSFAIVISLL